MNTPMRTFLVGGLGGLVGAGLVVAALFIFLATTRTSFAEAPDATPSPAMTHEQMHQMMDAMHGEGTSDRMHELMGEEGEQMMDQCVQMMAMMQSMMSMMGSGNGMDMMNGMGMMNGSQPSMQDMMERMMGR